MLTTQILSLGTWMIFALLKWVKAPKNKRKPKVIYIELSLLETKLHRSENSVILSSISLIFSGFPGQWNATFNGTAFSALTLLVGWQEWHLACKNLSGEVLAWLSVGAKCKWFAYGPVIRHCHPSISCSSKIQNGLPFCYQLTQVVLEKRPLNGC